MKPWERYQKSEKSGPWERFQKADTATVLDTRPKRGEEGFQNYWEPEQASVADWLERQHDQPFEDAVRDYEKKAKAFGLSGDPKSDLATLKHRESTLKARRKSSLGGAAGGQGWSPQLRSNLKAEGRSMARFGENVARNTPAVVSKALWDSLAGTIDLAAFAADFAMMGDPRGAPPQMRRAVETPTEWMREVADLTGEAYGVDEDFESTISGMVMEGAGTVATGVATRGRSIWGQMFTEGLRDSEAERGKKFSEFTDSEKDLALFKSMVYSAIGGKFERAGLGKIAPKWFKSDAVLPKSRVARMLRAGTYESGTEGAQNVLLNMIGAAVEGDRELLTGQRFKDLAIDMAMGFALGTSANVTLEAGAAAVERLDRKGEIARTIDRQMPYREDGSFNPAYKPMPLFNADGSWNMPLVDAARELEKAREEEEALTDTESEQAETVRERVAKAEQTFEGLMADAEPRDMGEAAWNIRRYNAKLASGLNPMEGATPTDWKFIDEYYSDEEVGAHVVQSTGSEDLVPVALQAKHGDEEAQMEFVNRTLVPADSEIMVEAGVTPEEAEAMREVEVRESEDFYRELYPEMFEAETPQQVRAEAMRDMIDFIGTRQLEGSTIEEVDEVRGFDAELNDLRDRGMTEAEIERFAFNRVQAAGLDPTDQANRPEMLAVYGRNESEYRRGVWRDVSKLYRGADPLTVVEETTEGFLKRMIAEGEMTWQDVAAWREMMGDRGGETEAELTEWVSEQTKAWMVGKSALLEREGNMPNAFRRFLAQMFEHFRHVFRRAAQLRGMDRRGELDADFRHFLDRANGMDEAFLRERLEREESAEAAIADQGPELMEALGGLKGIPRPDMEPEYRGELELVFESFGKNWKSYPKEKRTLDGVAEGLREKGFNTPGADEVVELLTRASRGEKIYGSDAFEGQASFAMAPMEQVLVRADELVPIVKSTGGLVEPNNSGKIIGESKREILGDYPNSDSGIIWNVSGRSLNKMFKQGRKAGEPPEGHRVRLTAMADIGEIIRVAKAFEVLNERDSHNTGKAFDLYAPYSIDGALYRLRIKGKVLKRQGNKAHSMRVEDVLIADEPVAQTRRFEAEGQERPIATGSTMTIREMFSGVNPYSGISFSLGRMDDLGGDPEQTSSARERTPEERIFAEKQREFRQTDSPTKAQRDELKKLQIRAVESRKRQRLQQSAERKIAAAEERRLREIKELHDQGEDVTAKLERLDELRKNLPTAVRHRLGGDVQISRRKTTMGRQNELNRRIARAEELARGHEAMKRKAWLRRTLHRFGQRGKKAQKQADEMTAYVRDLLQVAAFAANSDDVQRVRENVSKPKTLTDAEYEQTIVDFLGILQPHRRDVGRIEAAYFATQELIRSGKYERAQFREAKLKEVNDRIEKGIDVLTRGEGAPSPNELTSEMLKRSKMDRSMNSIRFFLFDALNGMQEHMQVLDGERGGFFEKNIFRPAFEAKERELTLEREQLATTWDDIAGIFGGDYKKASIWIERAMNDVVPTDIQFIDGKDKEMKTRELSKMQAIDLLNQWGDPSLQPTFVEMGVTEETIQQVRAFVGKEGVELSEYLRERYASVGQAISEAHEIAEGYPLDLVDGYGGKAVRAGASKEVDLESIFEYDGTSGRATVKTGSFKARTENTLPLVFGDALTKFRQHMQEANHYISHAEIAKTLTKTFGKDSPESQEMRRAIISQHGQALMDAIDENIGRVIGGSFEQSRKMWGMLDKLRSDLTKGTLAAKPDIMVKQLTSAPAFIDELGPVEYSKAWAATMRDPLKWAALAYRTNYTKNRLNNSQFADIQDQINMRRGMGRKMRWDDLLMINVKAGDLGAIFMGGTPVYVHYYQKAKSEGMTDREAEKFAGSRFGAAADRAQQASSELSKGFYLGSNNAGIGRTFFMYLTSPLQYTRILNVSGYNLYRGLQAAHKKNPASVGKVGKELASAFFVFHLLLPQIFQAVASGLTAFSDDDETRELFWQRQFRALIAGPGTALPVAGQIIDSLGNTLSGADETFFGSTGSPLIDSTKKLGRNAVKAATDPSPGAFFDVLQDAAQFKGIPLKQGVEQYEAIEDVINDDTEFPLQRLGGWSEWALGEK